MPMPGAPSPISPRVSVLMAVYNTAAYLAPAIESILHQTYEDFELIVIDDGSTDDSARIAENYAAKDARIRLIRQPNAGVGAATNRGLSASRGEYVAIMDSDDISEPERLACQVEYLDAHPDIAAVGTQWLMIQPDDQVAGADMQPTSTEAVAMLMYAYFSVHHPTAMIRRAAMSSVGGYREDRACIVPDYDLFMRMQQAGYGFANLPEVLFRWRLNPGGITHGKAKAQTVCSDGIRRLGYEALTRADPLRADAVADAVVRAFPAGTWFDQKLTALVPEHTKSAVLARWQQLHARDGTLKASAVAWLNDAPAHAPAFAAALHSAGLPWLASLVTRHHGYTVMAGGDFPWDDAGQCEPGMISVLVPAGADAEDLRERVQCLCEIRAPLEIIVFNDQGMAPEIGSRGDGQARMAVIREAPCSLFAAWDHARAVARGACLAYAEPGTRPPPALLSLGHEKLLADPSLEAVYAPPENHFLEARRHGAPLRDPAPHPRWTQETLLGRKNVRLSGFVHRRRALGRTAAKLSECGASLPLALAMELMTSRRTLVLPCPTPCYVAGVELKDRVLVAATERLLHWFYDTGLGQLPAPAAWPALSPAQSQEIDAELSAALRRGVLPVHWGNQAMLRRFFLAHVPRPGRSPVYRRLFLNQRLEAVKMLCRHGRWLAGLEALIYGALHKKRAA